MQSSEYIDNTIEKIRKVLAMHRSVEIQSLLDIIDKEYEIRVTCNEDNHIYIADRENEDNFLILYGYGHNGDNKKFWIDFNDYPKEKKIFAVLLQDSEYMDIIRGLMNELDMNTLKRIFPNLKKFMGLVEVERRNNKEALHEKWRSIYEQCIEIFGDEARG